MAKSDDLIRERSEYYAFKEQIANFIIKITNAVEAYNSPKNKISEMYQVNAENGDQKKFQMDQQKLSELASNLTNNTLTAIQTKIDQLSTSIQAALDEEEEERKRQEEEATRAAQEAANKAASSSN